MTMVRAACHCTAIRLLVKKPESVLDCSCTICRRYGALWAYPKPEDVQLSQGASATDTYIWGDKDLAFHRCAECGCVTHFSTVPPSSPRIFGVNARMIPTLDPATVRLIQKDNGHTGFFWTKSSQPPQASHHPPMPAPNDSDWR